MPTQYQFLSHYILNHYSLESRRTSHIIKIVESITLGDCHRALKDIFTLRSDGTLISSCQPRIAVGKRRFAVFTKELYDNELSTSYLLCYSRSGRWAGFNSCHVTEQVCNTVMDNIEKFSSYD